MQNKYEAGKIRTDNRAKIIAIAEMEFAEFGYKGASIMNIAKRANTAAAQELFSSCAAYGLKDSDHSAMVQALETMADHSLIPNQTS